jgi:uncharacterized protein YjgD (DUF1641 family)
MARPTDSYPESATHGLRTDRSDGEGRQRLEAALDEHGGDLAAAVESTDELSEALTTAILVAASADDEEVEHVTDSTANLVRAVDGLTTAEAASLAEDLGAEADELAETLEMVLELHREGHLEDLIELAKLASALDLDEDAIEGLNTVLGAVGEAQRESEPVGLLGMLGGLRDRDARAGLGYLLALVRAQGRRIGNR